MQPLFDSAGNLIAFRRHPEDPYVFNRNGKWIGWLPWPEDDVVDERDRYIGTIFGGDRLFHKDEQPHHGNAGNSGYPGYPGSPGHVANAGSVPCPPGTQDVPASLLA